MAKWPLKMILESPEIAAYCESHSSVPSSLCQEIEAATRETEEMAMMLSGPLVASFLGFLIDSLNVKRVLEIGCFTGYTALAMAERLPKDGRLVTLDLNEVWGQKAAAFWEKSPHGGKISLKLGSALDTMSQLKGPFDLVYIDADKTGYLSYLKKTLPLLSPTGVIVADNALQEGGVIDSHHPGKDVQALIEFNRYVHESNDLTSMLLPVRDGLMLVRKKK